MKLRKDTNKAKKKKGPILLWIILNLKSKLLSLFHLVTRVQCSKKNTMKTSVALGHT